MDTVAGDYHLDGISGLLALVPPKRSSTLDESMVDSVMGGDYNDGFGTLPNTEDLIDSRLLELYRTLGGTVGLLKWLKNPPSIALTRVGLDWVSDGIRWEFATRSQRQKLRRLQNLKDMNGRILLEFDAPHAVDLMRKSGKRYSDDDIIDVQLWLSKVLNDSSTGLLMDLVEPGWGVLTLANILDVWKIAVMDDSDRREREGHGPLEDCEITYV
eukprot:GDKJ01017856.1.p1 GENE.GDKJ01017856.1~~GDKJ01017856.1.p1  ORF type:complete len:238 (-),score=46.49 GDKJ01017856.1:33-674(-)